MLSSRLNRFLVYATILSGNTILALIVNDYLDRRNTQPVRKESGETPNLKEAKGPTNGLVQCLLIMQIQGSLTQPSTGKRAEERPI
jgi:hypothetical protein